MKRLSRITMGLLVVGFTLFGCSSMPFGQSNEGWTTLFDGSNLNSWNAIGNANWRLTDGNVQAELGSGYLVSKNTYTDFQVRAEFWVDDEANSGIFIRCADPKKVGADNCYEVNIYDKRPDPSYGTGGIVNVAKVSPMPKAGGKWNTYDITAKGSQLTVVLNGVRTVDVQDSKLASGPIALQYGAGVVKFRKVQIKQL
jgi:3-keto-disaccharide hydrolase